MDISAVDWNVLLIGGPSSVGKSTVAKQIARQLGMSWLQVDDLRLALQWSRVTLSDVEATRKLYFFEETPHVWDLPPEQLRDAFIGLGEVLSSAIAKVVTNHVATNEPLVLEGDAILPSLLEHQYIREHRAERYVRAVFIMPSNEQMIVENMVARGRGLSGYSEQALRANGYAKWHYGMWIANEASRRGLPVIPPQPWSTLVTRVMAESIRVSSK